MTKPTVSESLQVEVMIAAVTRCAIALEGIAELAKKASSADEAELERREKRRAKLRARVVREKGIHDHGDGPDDACG